MAEAAARTSATKGLVMGQLGSTIAAMRTAPGTNWSNKSSCFAPTSLARKVTPVALPPGRLRLATSPSLTGSPPLAKTTGNAVVAALAAIAEAVSSPRSQIPDGARDQRRGQAIDRIDSPPSGTQSSRSGLQDIHPPERHA